MVADPVPADVRQALSPAARHHLEGGAPVAGERHFPQPGSRRTDTLHPQAGAELPRVGIGDEVLKRLEERLPHLR